ncbi:hypothetical protein [Treponema pectinovorum]|uniref:hypothetical protein n=1 Tax=Treponema pectinovorum TaxID=164 RepID=UPI0011C9C3AE|nr:hypothetical protein [Treponema pectinovorum]
MEYTEELTVEDLKAEIPEQDYETLTLGNDSVAVRALLKAKVSIKGRILSTGKKYDELNEVCREAVLKFALYELFSFCGQESRAKAKYEDAETLIESYYGPILKKNDFVNPEAGGSAVGFVCGGKSNPLKRGSKWV